MTNPVIDTTLNLWSHSRKTRRSASGWISGNAVCCQHHGQTSDSRGRGGVMVTPDSKLSYSCFNCGFKTSYMTGSLLGIKFKKLLNWLGADEQVINQLSIEALKLKDQVSVPTQWTTEKEVVRKSFEYRELPQNSRPLNLELDHEHVDFLRSRGLSPDDYRFHVVDGESRTRIIIPYYHNGRVVGNTSRFYDNRKPKYIADRQPGYVFNLDAQRAAWQVCILVEGEFDAISVGGCAYMSSTINDDQVSLLNNLARKIIVVPDRDTTGLTICDRALELGYQVSIPPWAPEIKDVNDAVRHYGRLPTLMSILQHATSSKILIKMKRNKL